MNYEILKSLCFDEGWTGKEQHWGCPGFGSWCWTQPSPRSHSSKASPPSFKNIVIILGFFSRIQRGACRFCKSFGSIWTLKKSKHFCFLCQKTCARHIGQKSWQRQRFKWKIKCWRSPNCTTGGRTPLNRFSEHNRENRLLHKLSALRLHLYMSHTDRDGFSATIFWF